MFAEFIWVDQPNRFERLATQSSQICRGRLEWVHFSVSGTQRSCGFSPAVR